MSHLKSIPVILALALVGTAILAQETQWRQDHPRRAEVNKRLENQNKRIDNGVKNGTLTPGEAHKLHKEDRQIRKEEKLMASQNGGHITKQEQKTLNQQENKVSRQIRREKAGK
jgi:hypothetical protein